MRTSPANRVENAGLLAFRLERCLRKLAKQEFLDESKLLLIVERQCHLCAVCLIPFANPDLIRVCGYPRAVICRDCSGAITKYQGNTATLSLHRRFHGSPDKEARLDRYLNIFLSQGPFEKEDDIMPEPPQELIDQLRASVNMNADEPPTPR